MLTLYVMTVFICHRAGALQHTFWTGLFLSEKMQCYKTLNGVKNGSALPFLLGNFSYLKTKVSCLLKLMHITEGTNNF